MFEAIFLPRARAARDALSEEARTELDRIIRLLEMNPWTDDVTKFAVRIGSWTAGMYDDDRWEIAYRIVDDRFIEIVGIKRLTADG